MAKIVQLKKAGEDIYPLTTTDNIAFAHEHKDADDGAIRNNMEEILERTTY